MILVGEVWVFGRKIIDMRAHYESQRLSFAKETTIKKLIFYLPGQWYSLSPLESALTILQSLKSDASIKERVFLIPYILFVWLFDESRHQPRANHGIGCALALAKGLFFLPVFSGKKYDLARKILEQNSSGYF